MTETHGNAGGAYLPSGLPVPSAAPDGLDAAYWDAAGEHVLMVQRCLDCAEYQWEPEWMCHACQSLAMGWVATPAQGRVYSWTRVWHPVHSALAAGIPYLVVVVELPQAGNVRMAGNLLGDPEQEVAIGAAVDAVFEDHSDGYTLVQWRVS